MSDFEKPKFFARPPGSAPEPKAEFVDTLGLAEWLGVRPQTVRVWRHQGKGPPFVRVRRLIRYRAAAVRGWLDAGGV